MTNTPATYAPGQRSARSGRWAYDQPPAALPPECLPTVQVLDANPPATWVLDQLTRAVTAASRRCAPELVEYPDTPAMLAVLAAVEYRGGALIRGSSRRDLRHAAVVTGSDVSRDTMDRAVAAALALLKTPATVRQILRRRQGIGTSPSVRGALDRLRAAGRVRWLATDPVPWGTWALLEGASSSPDPDPQLRHAGDRGLEGFPGAVAEVVGTRGPAATAVSVDDPVRWAGGSLVPEVQLRQPPLAVIPAGS